MRDNTFQELQLIHLKLNLLPPEACQVLLPTPPMIPVYPSVDFRAVGNPATSTIAFNNYWIIAKST